MSRALVVVPPGSLVRDTCRTLRDATTHAEAVYVECVDAQSKQCDRHYDDVLLDVEKMLQEKQMRNEATLSTYREIYETCASHANALMGHATYKNASFKAPSDHDEASYLHQWTASCKDASKLTGGLPRGAGCSKRGRGGLATVRVHSSYLILHAGDASMVTHDIMRRPARATTLRHPRRLRKRRGRLVRSRYQQTRRGRASPRPLVI